MRYFAAAVLFIAVILAGCTSTRAQLDAARGMEEGGAYVEAVEVYLGLLDDDPDWDEARLRLRIASQRAVNDYIEQAYAAEAVGDYQQAMRYVGALDRMRGEVSAHGVALEMPADLRFYREDMSRRATRQLIEQAQQLEEEGLWMSAEDTYFHALRYASDPEHQDVHGAILRLQLNWAAADLEDGRFQEAYDRARQVMDLLGEDDPRWHEAERLSRAAVDASTLHAALLPVGVREELVEEIPTYLRVHLFEALEEHFWEEAPRFVGRVSPELQRRELRRLRYDYHRISHREAMELGRVLHADVVILTEVNRFRRVETDTREERLPVRFVGYGRAPADTSYFVQRVNLEMEVELTYRAIDPTFGLVLSEGTVDSYVARPIERGIFRGAVHMLDLDEEERDRFDLEAIAEDEHAAFSELINSVVILLTERLHNGVLADRQ